MVDWSGLYFEDEYELRLRAWGSWARGRRSRPLPLAVYCAVPRVAAYEEIPRGSSPVLPDRDNLAVELAWQTLWSEYREGLKLWYVRRFNHFQIAKELKLRHSDYVPFFVRARGSLVSRLRIAEARCKMPEIRLPEMAPA